MIPQALLVTENIEIPIKYEIKSQANNVILTATTATLFLPIDDALDDGQSTVYFATTTYAWIRWQ